MPTVVGVKLRNAAKPVLFDSFGTDPRLDDLVIVSTDRGNEVGTVVSEQREIPDAEVPSELRDVVRVATPDDRRIIDDLKAKETAAMPLYRRLVTKHKLDMKPIDVEYLFDAGKVVFYFVAEERVDFRELVRDLASEFHARIDMRQVGVRDEARMVGGLGHCGEQLCCVRFGGEFQPVSIRMAKEQDLPLNPLKISGLCGRLMCCLRYEYEAYKDFKGRAPKRGAMIELPDGKEAKVIEFNTPKETVTLRLPEGGGNVTIPLTGFECGKGASCPCKLSQDALRPSGGLDAMEEAFAAASVAPASQRASRGGGRNSGAQAASRQLRDTEPSAPEPAPTEAEVQRREAEQPREGAGRRRRKRGGGGEKPVAGTAETQSSAQKPKQTPSAGGGRRRGSGGQPSAAAKQAPQPPATGEAGTAGGDVAGRRRRRRRRPTEGSGTPE
jgi:cell fate regulator YaaT (PSP1 superfamily)